MPVKRRIPKLQTPEWDYAMKVHMFYGDCLIEGFHGCLCGLVDVHGLLNEALARRMWQEHKAEVLAAWKDPGLPWAMQEPRSSFEVLDLRCGANPCR